MDFVRRMMAKPGDKREENRGEEEQPLLSFDLVRRRSTESQSVESQSVEEPSSKLPNLLTGDRMMHSSRLKRGLENRSAFGSFKKIVTKDDRIEAANELINGIKERCKELCEKEWDKSLPETYPEPALIQGSNQGIQISSNWPSDFIKSYTNDIDTACTDLNQESKRLWTFIAYGSSGDTRVAREMKKNCYVQLCVQSDRLERFESLIKDNKIQDKESGEAYKALKQASSLDEYLRAVHLIQDEISFAFYRNKKSMEETKQHTSKSLEDTIKKFDDTIDKWKGAVIKYSIKYSREEKNKVFENPSYQKTCDNCIEEAKYILKKVDKKSKQQLESKDAPIASSSQI